jgi:hypothetical protein
MITEEQHQNIKKRLEEPKSHPEPRFEQHAKLVERYRLEHTSLDDLLPIIESSTAPLRSAAETALVAAIAWLDEVNHTRWRKPKADPPHISVRQANLAHLRSALDEFRRSRHFAILEPLRDAFDERGHLKPELVGVYKYWTCSGAASSPPTSSTSRSSSSSSSSCYSTSRSIIRRRRFSCRRGSGEVWWSRQTTKLVEAIRLIWASRILVKPR